MDTVNPYAAPQHKSADAAARPPAGLGYLRALTIIFVCGGTFGIGGALLGWLLGVLMPGYYRSVLDGGNDPGFDPVQVGLGLGVTQGLIVGLVVGCVVVLAVAISHRKRAG